MHTKTFYVCEIAAVSLSKIYFQKTQRKHVYNPNNCDFNRN